MQEILTNDRGSHINVRAAWKAHECNEDDMKMKYVGKRVRKNFEIRGEVVPYDDQITSIHYVQDPDQFMIHVNYDDGDSEDYEEYEVKEYLLEDD